MKQRTTGRLGFTLIEALVALVIVTLLSTIVVLRLTGTADSGEDLAAKSSLVVFQQLQETALRTGPAPLDALTLQTGEYDRGSVSFALEPSTSASQVAVLVDGSVVIGVVAAGTSCWALRMDFVPSATSPLQWWILAENVTSCAPSVFTDAPLPADGSGQNPNSPTILS
jgi:prepilin-type N-terminal cleavage/methylation domain-containing protein